MGFRCFKIYGVALEIQKILYNTKIFVVTFTIPSKPIRMKVTGEMNDLWD